MRVAVLLIRPERDSRRVASMSDIQQYLLDYDRNKKEASATAQRSANRKCGAVEGHNRTKADGE